MLGAYGQPMTQTAALHPPASHRSERNRPRRSSLGERIAAAILAAACLAVLAVAASLHPDPAGHGTHTQLGLAPCMWAQTFDEPCMTCGMTTSFTYAGQGRWGESFRTQPMGMVLVLLTSMAFWGALVQCVTGARIGAAIQPALRPRFFLLLGGLMLLAWGYKIATWPS